MDEIQQVPDFNSKKDTLFRARRKYLNVCKTEFRNLNDITIPEIMPEFSLFVKMDVTIIKS